LNKKELHPRQVLAKLSTDPVIENLEKWRTDHVRRNYAVERHLSVSAGFKRAVPAACATLGLLLIAPSATNVFAAGFDHIPSEGVPIAPAQVETDQSPIQQPEKPKKDFQLEQRLKEVEKKTTDLVPSVPSIPADESKPPAEDSDRSDQNDQPVNQPVNEQPAPPQQNHDEKTIDPVVTVKPHSSSSAAIDQKTSHKTFHHVSQSQDVPQAKTNKSFQNVSGNDEGERDSQPTAVQSSTSAEKGTVAVETVSGNQENIPTTQDTPLPKTASSDPTKAAAGLGVALLGLAWKTRRYGKA
jgi:hypothetical protein